MFIQKKTLLLETLEYSRVPNRRDGWNKRDGRAFPSKSISMMVLINVMVGNFKSFYVLFSKKNENFNTNLSVY